MKLHSDHISDVIVADVVCSHTSCMLHRIPLQCYDKSIGITSVWEVIAKPECSGVTKGSFNLYVYPHTTTHIYMMVLVSNKTAQVNKVTWFVTWVHEDSTLFRGGGRIIYALNKGEKHKNQKVEQIVFQKKLEHDHLTSRTSQRVRKYIHAY